MPAPASASRTLRLGVAGKLASVIGLLLAISLSIAVLTQLALARSHDRLETAYTQYLPLTAQTQELTDLLDQVQANGQLGANASAPTAALLGRQMDDVLIPKLRTVRTNLAALQAKDTAASDQLRRLGTALTEYYRLRGVNGFKATGTPGGAATVNAWNAVLTLGDGLRARVDALVATSRRTATNDYAFEQQRSRIGIGIALCFGLLAGGLLIRNIVPRLRRSARFAADFAQGHPSAPLKTSSSDELTDLARTLTAMVAQRSDDTRWERRQDEFVQGLQSTSSEDEAHELLQRHLQRAVPGSGALVLQRNNSANRLQTTTPPGAGDVLAERLVGAGPRACLALRLARTHRESPDEDSLIECTLCGDRAVLSTCEPLIVSGEVIGSVLVSHEEALDGRAEECIRTSVVQAAPVLGNLRNLAIAEFRANNDALTGLHNKRATNDGLRRLIAQAHRSKTPLAAIMVDLDHFKHINDSFGHDMGDEVLAAAGAAIASCLRDSDFAGRFGGEEFLVLLPDTDRRGAMQTAEKLRRTIGAIDIPGIDRRISASLGVAELLGRTGSTAVLLREADRALYSAKLGGRNRVAPAWADDEPAADDTSWTDLSPAAQATPAAAAPRSATRTTERPVARSTPPV